MTCDIQLILFPVFVVWVSTHFNFGLRVERQPKINFDLYLCVLLCRNLKTFKISAFSTSCVFSWISVQFQSNG